MTKNSLDLWSESFLHKHEIWPFQKYLKSDISQWKLYYSKLILHCNLTKVMLSNEKQPYRIVVKIMENQPIYNFKLQHWNDLYNMHGHPNQSGHITSSTAKC